MYERSYHAHVLKHDKAPVPRRSFPWKRVGSIVGIALVLTGIIFLIRVPQFQIREVIVEGTHVADPVEVSDMTLQTLEGAYLWVLPKSSIFLSKPDKVAAAIHGQFPRFKSVEVKRNSMHGIKVVVEEYPGTYLWCDEACSFMDEMGTVFADAPYFSGSAYLKIYAAAREPYPFNPLAAEQLTLLETITAYLPQMDINPIEVHFENDRKISVVFLHHGNRAEIYVDPTRNVDTALQVLYSGLRTDPLQKMYHDRAVVLQYLDLRFSNKVVYKFN